VLPLSADPAALHRAAQEAGGHARLVRAVPADGQPMEQNVAVFPEQSPAQARLHASLKRAFDPHGILNPGGMYLEW
jgi:glycolate oxidase FAD binding subunit